MECSGVSHRPTYLCFSKISDDFDSKEVRGGGSDGNEASIFTIDDGCTFVMLG